MTSTQRHFALFGALLILNATLVFLGFALGLMDGLPGAGKLPEPLASMPKWVLGLANVFVSPPPPASICKSFIDKYLWIRKTRIPDEYPMKNAFRGSHAGAGGFVPPSY